jgi:hypothetical protein
MSAHGGLDSTKTTGTMPNMYTLWVEFLGKHPPCEYHNRHCNESVF